MTPAQAKSIIKDAKKFFIRFGNELSDTQADIWKKALLPSEPLVFSKAKEALREFFISNPAYIDKYNGTMPPVTDFMKIYRAKVAPPLKIKDCPCCDNTRWLSIEINGKWKSHECRECQQGSRSYDEGMQCGSAQCLNSGKEKDIVLSAALIRFDGSRIKKLKNCKYVKSVTENERRI